jgi:ABC-type lipoprotein release transport system permease subunit
MKLLFQLSIRNLFRNKRRNVMLLVAIAVAVAGVNASNTLLRGYQYDMLESAINNLTGHVKVMAEGYADDPNIAHSFKLTSEQLPQLPEGMVVGWADRLRIPAVIMSERETRGIELVGVDPAKESISFIGDAQIEGEYLQDAEDGRVLVGKELARQLQTTVGRRLVLIAQGADGLNRERGYRIAGTYDADGTGLEKNYVFVGLNSLQTLLETQAVTELSVRVVREEQRVAAKSALRQAFPGLEVKDWRELDPQVAEMFKFADASLFIWFFLMMGALTFGLVNSLIAAVMERVKELGMMRALGMQNSTVLVQVVLESIILMTVGVVLGTGLSLLIYWSVADGIDLSAYAQGAELAGVSSTLQPVLLGQDVLLVAAMSIILGILASFYPAWRVIKIRPLDALRR